VEVLSTESSQLVSDEVTVDTHTVLVSCDSHVGPRLQEDLRQYCPEKYLAEFDSFTKEWQTSAPVRIMFGSKRADRDTLLANSEETRKTAIRNVLTDGGWDPHTRLRDMDSDGVAADVIFHGLQAGRVDPLPFTSDLIAGREDAEHKELVALGRHMYNQWLADFVSVSPERHVGLAQLPMWDIDASIKELEWARAAGLNGVYFPRHRAGLAPYTDPVWEPFWAACEDLEMTLTTHTQGAGVDELVQRRGEGTFAIQLLEINGAAARESTHHLVLGGVFERHPGLNLVFTEQPGLWWPGLMDAMDEMALNLHNRGAAVRADETTFYSGYEKRPSSYARHIFVGGSFLAAYEAKDAVEQGYASQVFWGSDYPHTEGTWQYARYDGEPPMTHLALRDTFGGIPIDKISLMAGANAVRVYGLDKEKLQAVADSIGAPTLGELSTPLGTEPEDPTTTTRAAFGAFRRPFVRDRSVWGTW
jgi:predicted TIM-barrel fold metal-dependent hydrolase